MYMKLLKPGGKVQFKTDNHQLFDYFDEEVLTKMKSVTELRRSRNLHESDIEDRIKILTDYEQRWMAQGSLIDYIELKKN